MVDDGDDDLAVATLTTRKKKESAMI